MITNMKCWLKKDDSKADTDITCCEILQPFSLLRHVSMSPRPPLSFTCFQPVHEKHLTLAFRIERSWHSSSYPSNIFKHHRNRICLRLGPKLQLPRKARDVNLPQRADFDAPDSFKEAFWKTVVIMKGAMWDWRWIVRGGGTSNCRVFRKWHKKLTCLPSWNPKFGGADLAAWSCKVRYSRGILTADLRPKGGVLASCPLTPRQVCDQYDQFISLESGNHKAKKQAKTHISHFISASPKVGPFLVINA